MNTSIEAAVAAYLRFDLSDVKGGDRVGVECTSDSDVGDGGTVTTTRFARVDRLTADDRGLCVDVTYDDGEIEAVHINRVTYIDGKHVLP